MARNRKKMMKLKKAHIWPSIFFLLLSIIGTMFACVIFMGIIFSYFAQERLEDAYEDAYHIGQMFTERGNADYDQLFRYLEKNPGLSEAVYLIDEEGEVLQGFGDPTYNLDRSLPLLNHQEYMLYFDKDTEYLFSNLGDKVNFEDAAYVEGTEVDIDMLFDSQSFVSYILSKEERENWVELLGSVTYDRKAVFYKDFFWIGTELPEGNRLVIKSQLVMYFGDFVLALTIGLMSFAFMITPVMFLFINAIVNVIHQGRMRKLMYTDEITLGNNWLFFEDQAGKFLKRKSNAKNRYAVVDITMMKYRNFCTFHGVEKGEDLLEKMDNILLRSTNHTECCAHNGKASFALLLKYTDRENCIKRVYEMLTKLEQSAGHGGLIFHAGIYFIESVNDVKKNRIDVSECYNRAGAARASITDENASSVSVFNEKMLEELLWEHKVEEKMQAALDHEEFHVYIQPKYNPVNDQLAGAEALVRWINEEDGFISPGRFIPIFEKNGFITKLDDYMLDKVAKLQSKWLAEGKKIVPVSVNVSRAHFADPNLAEHICGIVDQYQVPHKYIEIELTESAFFDDKDALLNTVRKLKEFGFDVSMDDFGAGYSSLNSLKDLPLDVLKLDAEFFRGEDLPQETDTEEGALKTRGQIVVSEAINLAKKLNMRIVAEGVEKKDQVEFLATQDCDMIQGFYYAKPMPANEYEERLG